MTPEAKTTVTKPQKSYATFGLESTSKPDWQSQLYKQFTYPAGEWQVRLTDIGIDFAEKADTVSIVAHIRTGDDIVRLGLLADAIRAVRSGAALYLYLAYLPFGRADRRFRKGDCYGIGVFASFINAMGFTRVITLDAHSTAAHMVRCLHDVGAEQLVKKSIFDFAQRSQIDAVTILYPDKGAFNRYLGKFPVQLGDNRYAITIHERSCRKERNPETGEITKFELPDDVPTANVMVVDDICDGGHTFLLIGSRLNEKVTNVNMGLYVTHGIFSRGFNELSRYYSRIYSTDSFRDDIAFEAARLFDADAHLMTFGNVWPASPNDTK